MVDNIAINYFFKISMSKGHFSMVTIAYRNSQRNRCSQGITAYELNSECISLLIVLVLGGGGVPLTNYGRGETRGM